MTFHCPFSPLLQNVRLSNELATVERSVASAERAKADAEKQILELQAKLEELEAMGARYLKNQVRKLEMKVFFDTIILCYFGVA